MRFGPVLLALCLGALPALAEPRIELIRPDLNLREVRGVTFGEVLSVPPDAGRDISQKALSQTYRADILGHRDGRLSIAIAEQHDGSVRIGRVSPYGEFPGGVPRDHVDGSAVQKWLYYVTELREPTSIYKHKVLGGVSEAGAIRLTKWECQYRSAQGNTSGGSPCSRKPEAWIEAGPSAVFEDHKARLADLDGDGTPEIVIVKSSLDHGAALAVVKLQNGSWRIAAETPPIGQPNRWLNPAATADFDGDGQMDIAVIRTPHLAGILQVWTWRSDRLVLKAESAGYSNHVIGSPVIGNAAAVDVDGDGFDELAVPTLDRRSLAILSLKDGVSERQRILLPARIERGVVALGSGRDTTILAGLEDGRIALVRP